MKIMESAENYLETILVLSNKGDKVRSIDIVTETGYEAKYKPCCQIT